MLPSVLFVILQVRKFSPATIDAANLDDPRSVTAGVGRHATFDHENTTLVMKIDASARFGLFGEGSPRNLDPLPALALSFVFNHRVH